jgi:hypothetical protein
VRRKQDWPPARRDRPAGFVRGSERLDQLLADPRLASDVAAAHADAEMDRVYAMNLAMIRKAAQMPRSRSLASLASARVWCRGWNIAMTCCCPLRNPPEQQSALAHVHATRHCLRSAYA